MQGPQGHRSSPACTTAATGVGRTVTTAVSHLPATVAPVAQCVGSEAGVSKVAKLRLEPSAAQVELLRGYCGTARAAYDTRLYQVRANLGQRAAAKTYDITGADLTR